MPDYEVVTPLSNGRKKPIPAGKIVSLPETQGAKLVKIGALRIAPLAAKSPMPGLTPAPTPSTDPASQAPADPEPRIRIATVDGADPVEAGGVLFNSEFRLIAPGEIDEAQLLAMVESPSLRFEALPVDADPASGWVSVWGAAEQRALVIEGLRGHVEYDIAHNRPHDRVGLPRVDLVASSPPSLTEAVSSSPAPSAMGATKLEATAKRAAKPKATPKPKAPKA